MAVADGIYRLQNVNSGYYLNVSVGGIRTNNPVQQYSLMTDEETIIRQLWRVTYIDDGCYVIRPYHKSDMGLGIYGNDAVINIAGWNDTPSYTAGFLWDISYQSNGYVFKYNGVDSYTLQINGASISNGAAAKVSSNTNSNSCKWNLLSESAGPIGIKFYDTLGYPLSNSVTPERYITPGETKSLEMNDLQAVLYTNHPNLIVVKSYQRNIRWSASNAAAVTINATTGAVTGVESGQTSITAKVAYGSTNLSRAYEMTVLEVSNGEYFIQNREKEKYLQIDDGVEATTSGATMEQWEFEGNGKQKWSIMSLDNGYYQIISEESGYALSVPSSQTSTADVPLVQERYVGASRQQWSITKTTYGSYKIKARSSEGLTTDLVMVVGAAVSDIGNGVDIEQREYQANNSFKDEWLLAFIKCESSVVAEGQQQSEWCWVTTARMFSKHFYPSVTYTQSQAVEHIYGYAANVGGDRIAAQMAINYYISNISGASIYTVIKENVIYSEDTLVRFLDDGYVVYVSRAWVSNLNNPSNISTGHAILVSGYFVKDSDIYFLIKDPAYENSTKIMSYNMLCNGRDTLWDESGDTGIWYASIVIDTTYANNTIPYYFDR